MSGMEKSEEQSKMKEVRYDFWMFLSEVAHKLFYLYLTVIVLLGNILMGKKHSGEDSSDG